MKEQIKKLIAEGKSDEEIIKFVKNPNRWRASDEVEKIFTIKAPKEVMQRFENLLAIINRSGSVGHSGTFAMDLDGDGNEYLDVSPEPEVNMLEEQEDTSGYGVEVARSEGYGGLNIK